MRRDFILPTLLLVALLAMGVYATTAEGEKDSEKDADLITAAVTCENAQLISRIAALPEASGLAVSRQHPNLFWSHNDSSDPLLYAIDGSGALRGQVQLSGAAVTDWEAVAIAPCPGGRCLYVGDIGDNERKRRSITIYRTREPSLNERATGRAEVIEATYPEGPQDAEALFVLRDTLFLVTKGEDGPIRIYQFPSLTTGAPVTLQLVATLTDSEARKRVRITDAAASPEGQWVALRSNDMVLFYKASTLVSGKPDTPLAFDLASLNEPQGEGLAWADERTLFLAGEAEGGGTFARLSCTLPR